MKEERGCKKITVPILQVELKNRQFFYKIRNWNGKPEWRRLRKA